MKRFYFFHLLLVPSMLSASILIFPFENRSNRNFYWLSESVSYTVYINLLEEKIDVVPIERRNLIYEELQIPLTTPITRATSIKIALMCGADKFISGDFLVSDQKVIVTSRIVDVKSGKLGETISIEGEINELIALQNFLSWRLLQNLTQIDESKKEDFLKKRSNIPLPAWENFIKGLLAKDGEKKEIFFLKALNLSPDFSLCRWELSNYYFRNKDYDKCLKYISPLFDLQPLSIFLSSLCHFYKKDYEKAIDGFKKCLEKEIAKAASANNLGVCYSITGEENKAFEFLEIAIREREEPDIYFNLGILSSDNQKSFDYLKKSVKLAIEFPYFYAIYQKLLTSGEIEIAEKIKEISKGYFSSDIDAPLTDLKSLLRIIEEEKELVLRIEEVEFYKKNAISLMETKNLKEAENSIRKAIHISPFDWEAHLILARIQIFNKDLKNAMKELKFSLWLENKPENNLEIGKLLIENGEKVRGVEYIKKALSLRPDLEEAKEILKKIER
ncbi:MAG: hypothetical protein ACUVUG_04640 [Candidatus Aminicenantia bacterium]